MNRTHHIIVIDSREQRPYHFEGAMTQGLGTGDYSVAGFEQSISIERKSLADLLGCVGQSRNRFEAELARLSAMLSPAVVIEATPAEVLRGTRHTSIHPNSVLGSLYAWSMRYRLPFWFCDTRSLAEITTERLLVKAAQYAADDPQPFEQKRGGAMAGYAALQQERGSNEWVS
jgi:ERCC4-type nuclease